MAASIGVQARPNAPKPSGRGITRYQRFEYRWCPGKEWAGLSAVPNEIRPFRALTGGGWTPIVDLFANGRQSHVRRFTNTGGAKKIPKDRVRVQGG
jgi:hypothetical protein